MPSCLASGDLKCEHTQYTQHDSNLVSHHSTIDTESFQSSELMKPYDFSVM